MSNLQFQDAQYLRRKTIGTVQTAENIRISVKNDIAEVLSVGVENCINSYEVSDGEVTFFGKTALKFLYNDGNGLAGSNYNADFTASLQNDLIVPGCKMSFDVTTVDTKVQPNANTATITVLLEVVAYAYVAAGTAVFVDGEDLFLRKESIQLLQSANTLTLPMLVDEELTSSHTIDGVLLAESCLNVENFTNTDGVLHLFGEATVRLTYLSQGSIVTDTLPFKFDRELDSAGIDPQAQLTFVPKVRATKVRLAIAENTVNTDFSVEISANVYAEATTTTFMEVATDAYGTDSDFTFQRENLTTTLPCGSARCQKAWSANLPQESGNILLTAVNVCAVVTKCTALTGCAQVEGVVCCTAIFQKGEGYQSNLLELPFVQNVEGDFLCTQCSCRAEVSVGDFRLIQSNGGLQATANLCIALHACKDVCYSVVVAAEQHPFDKSQLPAIEVCLASKGETLWELSKALHLSESDLLAVNPEITSPLEKDTRIVVYNKI